MPIENFNIQFYDGKRASHITERIIREVPVHIYVNDNKIITIACAGIYLEELAVGFLRSEGIIEAARDIDRIEVNASGDSVRILTGQDVTIPDGKSIFSSGAKGSGTEVSRMTISADIHIQAQTALDLMEAHLNATKIHRITHGTHCSTLADRQGLILISREDIGRHNTFDMIGGHTLIHTIDCSDMIIATTGRVSSEIVSKIRRLNIPIILSHAVPTSRAIEVADEAGITIIGYMRSGNMNIYTHKERVIF